VKRRSGHAIVHFSSLSPTRGDRFHPLVGRRRLDPSQSRSFLLFDPKPASSILHALNPLSRTYPNYSTLRKLVWEGGRTGFRFLEKLAFALTIASQGFLQLNSSQIHFVTLALRRKSSLFPFICLKVVNLSMPVLPLFGPRVRI